MPPIPEEPEVLLKPAVPDVPEVPEVTLPPDEPDVPFDPPPPPDPPITETTRPSLSVAKTLSVPGSEVEPVGTLKRNKSCFKTDCPGESRLLENFLFSAI